MELDQFIKEVQERKKLRRDSVEVPGPALAQAAETTSAPAGVVPTLGNKTASESALREGLPQVKQRLHTRLVDKLDPAELKALPEKQQRVELRQLLEAIIEAEEQPLTLLQRRMVIDELLDDIFGFGPLEPLLRDAAVSDILVNGPNSVYVERNGVLEEEGGVRFRDNSQLLEFIQRIVARVGRRVDEGSPMVDARLLDGSRFNAVVPPLAVDGPMISIRRFGRRPLKIADLLALKAFTPEMCRYMEAAVKARLNILVAGGTGSGKTTLLNTLSSFIPANERIITIEDAAELQLQQRHVGRLETRPPNVEGKGEVTIRDLLRNSLRMRPNRIIIGECRGAEALDMLQAMNTGHEGSLTTLHANAPRDALSRLETMIMLSQLELPLRAMRQQIAAAVNVIIQVDRLPGGPRRVTSITEVTGMEGEVVTLQDLFVFRQLGVDGAGRTYGEFVANGVTSFYEQRFKAASVALPPDLFRERVLLEV